MAGEIPVWRKIRRKAATPQHVRYFIASRVEFGRGVEQIVNFNWIPVAPLGTPEPGYIERFNRSEDVTNQFLRFGYSQAALRAL